MQLQSEISLESCREASASVCPKGVRFDQAVRSGRRNLVLSGQGLCCRQTSASVSPGHPPAVRVFADCRFYF